MGSPLGPIFADVFMPKVEQNLNRFSTNKPLLFLRYVDDIFCILKKKHNIPDFLQRMNKWHKNIKFTVEYEDNNKIPFLDTMIIRDVQNDKFQTTIYRKPIHTDLYLLYDSNQSRKYKLGLIRTLVIRILLICSSPSYSKTEIDRLKVILKNNGYPEHIIKRGVREGEIIAKNIINKQQQSQNLPPSSQLNKKKILFFTIPYYGNEFTVLGQRITKICKKLLPHIQLNIAYKKFKTLKSIFLPLQKGKDDSRLNKKLVYKIQCKNCDLSYIGETAREKQIRMNEHQYDIRNDKITSAVAQHANTHSHSFDFQTVETLALETAWKRRVIKESLHTQFHY
ncbi:unnamed protein product, partial [Didymodactylos carnosus]